MAGTQDEAVSQALQKLLQPTETIKFACEVTQAPGTGPNSEPSHLRDVQRCLGIISNLSTGKEAAAILIFRSPSSPLIISTIPILSDFRLSIAQTSIPSTSSDSVPTTRFLVTFGSVSTNQFSIVTDQIHSLANLIAELKRLQSIAINESWTISTPNHSWVKSYDNLRYGDTSQNLARFDSISSAYSQRASEPTALRIGLGSIDWDTGRPSDTSDTQENDALDQRARWVVQQMQQREKEFTQKQKIKIWCGTFNVNDKLPKGTNLSAWLEGSEGAELLVFGFQEFDLSTDAMLRYTSTRENAWRHAIETSLGERANLYEKLHSRQLVGALLLIYSLKSIRHRINSVTSNSLATGLLGLVANKGACAIRFKFDDTWICFANSHLAAMTNQVEQRNFMVKDTIKFLSLPANESIRDAFLPNLQPEAERPIAGQSLFDAHHLIWMGDLNYRIDLTRSEVLRLVETKDWKLLQRFDQLLIEKEAQHVFKDFREAPIDFAPTFKFNPNSSIYDTSEKMRVPSWTDRVMWLSTRDDSVRSLSYRGHPEIMLSDHKPVSALLQVETESVQMEKRQAVQRDIMSQLDQFEKSETLPDVKIFPSPSIEFSAPVEYSIPQTEFITLKNVGEVVAIWSFVLKPEASSITPDWLTVSPSSGIILPGQETRIEFKLLVTAGSAQALTFGETELNELLIISIEKKDLFLAVSAREWQKTIFGVSLTRLAKLSEPIRKVLSETLKLIAEREEDDSDAKVSVVEAVYRMMDFLAEHGLRCEQLFLRPGKIEHVNTIRECLDTGDPFPSELLSGPNSNGNLHKENSDQHLHDALAAATLLETDSINSKSSPSPQTVGTIEKEEEDFCDIGAAVLSPRASINFSTDLADSAEQVIGVHSMADCLLEFLKALPEPVVTYDLYPRAIRCQDRDSAYSVVKELPAIHANTLLYIIAFLKVLVSQTNDEISRLTRSDQLAIVFSNVLLRPDPSQSTELLPAVSIPRRKKAFIDFLLQEITPTDAA